MDIVRSLLIGALVGLSLDLIAFLARNYLLRRSAHALTSFSDTLQELNSDDPSEDES